MMLECTERGCKLLHGCSHRTWLNCRLVTTKRSERTLKYSYVYISRHFAGRFVGSAVKVTLRAVHQLYGRNATIISTAIKWNYLRHLRLHRFLIATGDTIRHIGTRSYMGWQIRFPLESCIMHLRCSFGSAGLYGSDQSVVLSNCNALWVAWGDVYLFDT